MPSAVPGNKTKNPEGQNGVVKSKKAGNTWSAKTRPKRAQRTRFEIFVQDVADKISSWDPFPAHSHVVEEVNPINKRILLITTGILVTTSFMLVCIGASIVDARSDDPLPNDTFSAHIITFSSALLLAGLGNFGFSLCGFVGVLRENIILIRIFYVSLIVFLSVKFIFVVFVFVFTTTARTIIGNAVSEGVVLNYRDNTDIETTMDYLQMNFKCCGLREDGFKDWSRSVYFNCSDDNPSTERCGAPWSCCRNGTGLDNPLCGSDVQKLDRNIASRAIHTKGCLLALQEWCKAHAIAIGALLIFEAIFLVVVIFQSTHMVNELQMMIRVYRGPWWVWVGKKPKPKPKGRMQNNPPTDQPNMGALPIPEIVVDQPVTRKSLPFRKSMFSTSKQLNVKTEEERGDVASDDAPAGLTPGDDRPSTARSASEKRAPSILVLKPTGSRRLSDDTDEESMKEPVKKKRRSSFLAGLPKTSMNISALFSKSATKQDESKQKPKDEDEKSASKAEAEKEKSAAAADDKMSLIGSFTPDKPTADPEIAVSKTAKEPVTNKRRSSFLPALPKSSMNISALFSKSATKQDESKQKPKDEDEKSSSKAEAEKEKSAAAADDKMSLIGSFTPDKPTADPQIAAYKTAGVKENTNLKEKRVSKRTPSPAKVSPATARRSARGQALRAKDRPRPSAAQAPNPEQKPETPSKVEASTGEEQKRQSIHVEAESVVLLNELPVENHYLANISLSSGKDEKRVAAPNNQPTRTTGTSISGRSGSIGAGIPFEVADGAEKITERVKPVPGWLNDDPKSKKQNLLASPENVKPTGRKGDGGSVARAVSMEVRAALHDPGATSEIDSTRLMTSAINLMAQASRVRQAADDKDLISTLGPRGHVEDDDGG